MFEINYEPKHTGEYATVYLESQEYYSTPIVSHYTKRRGIVALFFRWRHHITSRWFTYNEDFIYKGWNYYPLVQIDIPEGEHCMVVYETE